jgi:hypothetical protein
MALSESALEDAFLAELFQGGPNRTRTRANHRPPDCLGRKVEKV